LWLASCSLLFAQGVKLPNVAGAFYPLDPKELSRLTDSFIEAANPQPPEGNIFGLILPHAGYGFSGKTAAFGYKLIKGKPYKTVIILAPSHYYPFNAVSVYPEGAFRTPLGDIEVDKEFTRLLLDKDKEIIFEPLAFEKEHSLEVQLPFLQRSLSGFKIVPIVMGSCSLETCKKLAELIKAAVGERKDILIIASTDMYHGYDFEETEKIDRLTLSYLKNMDAEGLYSGLRDARLQLCGGLGVVTTLLVSKGLGNNNLKVLNYTNSAIVTGKKQKGIWTVGYSACAISNGGGQSMLNKEQKRKLLALARNTIDTYLKTGKKLEVQETDPLLLQEMGAFVTLHKSGELRGCIGNIIGKKPLYITIRDMAIESAFGDPRFPPLDSSEFKDVDIEVSVLSPLKKIDSVDEIKMGIHGVLVKRGFASGVFLPQVAQETGWSKEEFLSNLCVHKAGLPADAERQIH
jgi:hypothetical protein